jgi:hypothetical protein
VIGLSEHLARDRASERQRSIENACDLAGRLDLVPTFLSSDRGLSEILHVLRRLRALDQVMHEGPDAVLPN